MGSENLAPITQDPLVHHKDDPDCFGKRTGLLSDPVELEENPTGIWDR